MRRNDRKKTSDDNSVNHPSSPKKEPIPYKDLEQRLKTAQSQRSDAQAECNKFKQKVEEATEEIQGIRAVYEEEQKKYQSTLTLYQTTEKQYKSTLALYVEEQRKSKAITEELEVSKTQAQSYFKLHQDSETQAQSYLKMYKLEKVRGDELGIQLTTIQGERDRYLTLYNESQTALKTERRSKAGIKGWETRRKKENERLKQEIAEMAMVLRDSMERKDEAMNSLYAVAERMDRIQKMVDSVEDNETTSPIGMVQKLQRMWYAIKEILAE